MLSSRRANPALYGLAQWNNISPTDTGRKSGCLGGTARSRWPRVLASQIIGSHLHTNSRPCNLPDTKVRARHGTPLQTPANAMIGSDATTSASWSPRPCHLCRTSEDHLYPVLAIMAWCKVGPQAQNHSEHLKVSPMLQEHRRTCRIPRLVLHKAQDRC